MKKIFLTIILLIIMVIMSSQSSALWSCLLVIPFSIILIMSFSKSLFNGFFLMLFVMLFVGGLLVLLVSVCCVTIPEQNFNFSKILPMFLLIMMLPFIYKNDFFFSWGDFYLLSTWLMQNEFFVISILFLCLVLIILMKLIFFFKGMIRLI